MNPDQAWASTVAGVALALLLIVVTFSSCQKTIYTESYRRDVEVERAKAARTPEQVCATEREARATAFCIELAKRGNI